MKNVPIREVPAGSISAADIVTAHGQIIASRGAILSDSLIAKLRFYGIQEVSIVESDTELATPAPGPYAVAEPAVPLERDASTYSTRIKVSDEFKSFQKAYNKNLILLEMTFDNIKAEKYNDVDLYDLLIGVEELFKGRTTLDLFNTIHSLDVSDNIYASNLNVALISRGIGRWLKFPKDALDILTLAGLFHDIGKIAVPKEILNKTGKLTSEEFEAMKKHTLQGQRMLKKVPGMDHHILNAAIQHHEKYDGSGYPMGLEGDEIDPHAAIVAIADVYEAMTALRPHRKPLSPFQVIEAFEADGLTKYNTKYVLTFLERIANAYQNRMVLLTDGRKARIIYINQGKLSHPIVEFEDKSTADLSREKDLHISEVL